MKTRGYTLLEMVIAVAVILVLASLALGLYASNVDGARAQQTEMQIQSLDLACKAYKDARGAYPADDRLAEHLGKPWTKTLDAGTAVTRPPFCAFRKDWVDAATSTALDAWGRKIRYANPGTRNKGRVDLWSAGPNGVDGDADDLRNWKD